MIRTFLYIGLVISGFAVAAFIGWLSEHLKVRAWNEYMRHQYIYSHVVRLRAVLGFLCVLFTTLACAAFFCGKLFAAELAWDLWVYVFLVGAGACGLRWLWRPFQSHYQAVLAK